MVTSCSSVVTVAIAPFCNLFFFKQKTAYEMRISDWSSDVCSSDLRWFDLVLESKDNIDQPDNLRAMVFWGHAANSQTRLADMKKAMEKLDLLVIIDPYPTVAAVMNDRQNGTYLLPAATKLETVGSATASNQIGRAHV